MCCVSDEDLVNRWKVSRDQEAFAEIERRYHDRLFGSAYNALLCYEDAEEAVQDTLLRISQKIYNPLRGASFGTWVYTIHHNVVVDSLRRINREKRRQDSIEEILSILAPRRPMSPEKIVEFKEKNRAFWECKLELSEEEREIFLLRHEEGLSVNEIQKIMRLLSKRTTERRLTNARCKLEACMISKGYVVASLFHEGDLKDPAGLAVKLRNAKDPLSQYLRWQFSHETQRLLDEYDGSGLPSEALLKALVDELNRVLKGDCLYDEKRFDVKLTEETRRLMEQLKGEALISFNRFLLEEAYPREIAKSRFFDDP